MSFPRQATLDLFDADFDEGSAEAMDDTCPPRSEKRESVVRIVEYSRYPRIDRNERRMVAFTRNQSRSGLCLVAREPEMEGTLLRIGLRTVDGGAALDALAHVAWCERRSDGRYWIGVALLEHTNRRMRKVRRLDFAQDDAETATGSGRFATNAWPRLAGSA